MALKPKRTEKAKVAEKLRGVGRSASPPVLYRIDLKEHLRTPGVRARLERVRKLRASGARSYAPKP
jgi:hypothetical protein